MTAPPATAPSMRALVVRGPAEHGVEELPRPQPGPGEALVATSHVALCGTDLKLLRGSLHDADYPVVPGHEWAGTVLAAPDRPELVGTVVVGSNFTACERCEWCVRGLPNLCLTLDEVGFTRPGACAEAFTVPAANLRPLPVGLTPAEGCLLEPLGVALHAVERAPAAAGREVGVIGGGTVGLLVAQLAAADGAARVTVVDPVSRRRAVAEQLGLATVPDLAGWGADLPDLVVDATGVAAVFPAGLAATRPGGTYVLVGYSGEDRVAMAPSEVMLRELTVVGVLSGYGTLDRALDRVAAGDVRLGPLLGGGPAEPVPLAEYRAVLDVPADETPLRHVLTVGADPLEGKLT